LPDRFGGGQLIAGVDAQDFVGIAFDNGGNEADGARKLDRIGQIEFAFGIGIADVRQQVGNFRDPERQDTRVADSNLALGLAGVFFFADREGSLVLCPACVREKLRRRIKQR